MFKAKKHKPLAACKRLSDLKKKSEIAFNEQIYQHYLSFHVHTACMHNNRIYKIYNGVQTYFMPSLLLVLHFNTF